MNNPIRNSQVQEWYHVTLCRWKLQERQSWQCPSTQMLVRPSQCYLCKAWHLEEDLSPVQIPDQAGYVIKVACRTCLKKITRVRDQWRMVCSRQKNFAFVDVWFAAVSFHHFRTGYVLNVIKGTLCYLGIVVSVQTMRILFTALILQTTPKSSKILKARIPPGRGREEVNLGSKRSKRYTFFQS